MQVRLPNLYRQSTKAAVTLALPLLLSGCLGIGADGNRVMEVALPQPAPALKPVDPVKPIPAVDQKMMAAFGGVYTWRPAQDYLDGVLVTLSHAGPNPSQPYRITILNSPVVNAFALPSGDLFVTRGLLALANDTSEIAAVMAHEIGHVTAHHAAQREEFEKRSELITKATSIIENHEKGKVVAQRSEEALASFSRQQELDADKIGINVIGRAGYDPYAAARFLTSLQNSTSLRAALVGKKSSDNRPDIMATHPSTPQRIETAIREARGIAAPGIGKRDRAAYLAAINGMEFGDDPAEGFVRGNKFIHPKLDFGFTAPANFVLENSPKALLGIANGGRAAVRLDSVHLPFDTSLKSYLSSGWLDGLHPESIRDGTSNGLPVATATASGGQWSFRVAAIRFGTDVYRMIFATRDLTPEQDNEFLASIASFHRLTTDETANIRHPHIVLVTAQAGDTVASLAARMVVQDRPEDYFRMLNGLGGQEALQPGTAYKLIAD